MLLSGGKSVEYNASALMTFTGEIKDDSRYHMDTDGFDGNTVLFEPTKVSTNVSGNAKTGLGFRIIVDKRRNGADNIRTLVKFLEDRGRIKGDRRGYKVLSPTGEEISDKFSWKNIYEDLQKDKATYKAFMLTAKEELEKLLADAPDVAGEINVFDLGKICNGFSDDGEMVLSAAATISRAVYYDYVDTLSTMFKHAV